MRRIIILGTTLGLLLYSTVCGLGWITEYLTLRSEFTAQDIQIWRISHSKLVTFQQQYGDASDDMLPIADRTIRTAARARISEVEVRHPEWRTNPPR